MEFMPVRNLGTNPQDVWNAVKRDVEAVITNGRPGALMIDIFDGDVLKTLITPPPLCGGE
ncbi:MAG: hypothetical protein LBU32_14400 [Clostridiales bacterium]|nr:hypothetical protein [Clostridiales bacterium]